MIQADLMRNKPLVPGALKPFKGSLSPHYNTKKFVKKQVANDVRDRTARAAMIVAKADVNSLISQQEQERLVDIRTPAAVNSSNATSTIGECERKLISSQRGSNPFKEKRQSVRFDMDYYDDKENQSNLSNINKSINLASELVRVAQEEMFNHKYKDYKSKIDEVNKAKIVLQANRYKMSFETKKRLVKHIKRKLMIIEMMEEEFYEKQQEQNQDLD